MVPYRNSHERDLPGKVWEEIYNLADRNQKMFLPLANFMTNNMGWTVENINKYSYNEQGMLDLLRWNRSYSQAAKEPWGNNIRN